MDILTYKNRLDFLDVAKGILIITVVISHSNSFLAQYMYWFHMPAFFFISGVLFKEDFNIKDQLTKFFIPYFLFSLIDIFLGFLTYPQDMSFKNFILYFYRHIYSGKAIGGVFWFIPILFFTKLIFNVLKKNFRNVYIAILIIGLYTIAHVYSIRCIPETIVEINDSYYKLWDFDVLPLALTYYAIGYYLKNFIYILNSKIAFLISLIASLIYIKLNSSIGFYYYLNMKFSYFKFPILDLLVPALFTSLIISFSYTVKDYVKLLKYAGKNSLIIMYLHKPIAILISSKISINSFIFVIIGLLIPLVINKLLLENYTLLNNLTKGNISKISSHKIVISH